MNKVILIGRLTRDPELAETQSGTAVCKFSIAVNRPYGENQTDFFNCVAWKGLGENVAKYCKKGHKIAVSGSIEIRSFEDKNGNKRQATDIVCNEVEFLQSKNEKQNEKQNELRLEEAEFDDLPF